MMTTSRHITDAERRTRLVVRHRLDRGAARTEDAVRAVAAQHATDPATPYLSAWARVPGCAVDDLDRALYSDRTLWRLHAMRRTLFVVPVEDAAAVQAGASRAVAQKERARVEQWLAPELPVDDVAAWVSDAEAQVLDVLADGVERRTQDLTSLVSPLATELTLGSGKWSRRAPLSSRLLYVMAMDGRIVRARPAGSWRSSQYRWAATAVWFGRDVADELDELDEADGRTSVLRRYLAAHGPVTMTDVRWWTGWTAARSRRAIRDANAVTVTLDGGDEGFVLPDDTDSVAERAIADASPVVALLPALDSTTMGWKRRDWYLGDHATQLFDRNGNAGPTIWVDGRVVGGWGQRPDGRVAHRVLSDVDDAASARIDAEVDALSQWLDGEVVIPRFRTPLERTLSS